MNIALFADLHGRILLCFKLCARWEKETGQKIDLILQAGDLGAFPEVSRLDKATQKRAREDETVLGFMHHFLHYHPHEAAILTQTTCPLIFVRGNHEDHCWLDELEQQTSQPIFPIDAYQRLWCLKSGMPFTFRRADEEVTILGIGRVGVPDGKEDLQQAKYIQHYEVQRLLQLPAMSVDILLTHDTARHFVKQGAGLAEIHTALTTHTPQYHFFGHYGKVRQIKSYKCAKKSTKTISCKLADLRWDKTVKSMTLEDGAMGILRWQGPANHKLEIIDADWYKEYSALTWRSL